MTASVFEPRGVYTPSFSPDDLTAESTVTRTLRGVDADLAAAREAAAADPTLSDHGRRALVAREELASLEKLAGAKRKIGNLSAELARQAADLEKAELAGLPKLSEAERLAMLAGFRAAPPEMKEALLRDVRAGADPILGAAIITSHPVLSGLESFTVRDVRVALLANDPHAQAVAAEREALTARVERVASVAIAVDGLYASLLGSLDHAEVPPHLLPTRSSMTFGERVLYEVDHGPGSLERLAA